MSRLASLPVVRVARLAVAAMLGACSVYDETLLDSPLAADALPDDRPSDASQGGSSGSNGGGGSMEPNGVEPRPEASATLSDARESSAAGGGGASGGSAGSAGSRAGAGNGIFDAAADRAPDVSALKDAGPVRDASGSADSGLCAGMALRFDGSAAYASAKLLSAADFTMEVWIRTTSSRAGTAAYQGLGLLYADISGGADDFGLSITNQNAAFVVGNPDTTLFSSAFVSTGTWRHIAVTRLRATGLMTVYVDGVASGQVNSANTAPLVAASALTIGANVVSSRYYIGDLDEVRFWNVVRSPAQIVATLHTRLVGNEAGLEDYYRFDQASGARVSDLSTTKAMTNDAVITGAPEFVPSDAPIFCD